MVVFVYFSWFFLKSNIDQFLSGTKYKFSCNKSEWMRSECKKCVWRDEVSDKETGWGGWEMRWVA